MFVGLINLKINLFLTHKTLSYYFSEMITKLCLHPYERQGLTFLLFVNM